MTSAEEPKPNWEQIEKDALAEKKALDAKKLLIEAQKLLDAAQAPVDPTKKSIDDKVAAANAAKALADAEKASADSKKAQADASLAALKAQIGDIPDSGFKGDVTLKDKAGVIEAALLSAKAVNVVSRKITEMITPERINAKTVLLLSASEIPNFQSLLSLRAQIQIVNGALNQSSALSDQADKADSGKKDIQTESVPIVAAAGLALDALNKAIGFFRTDYTVGGIDVTAEDSMLVNSLPSSLIARSPSVIVKLPALYNAQAVSSTFEKGIGLQLAGLTLLKTGLQSRVSHHEEVSAAHTEAAGKESDPEKKADVLKKANRHKVAADVLKAVINAYDAFYAKLVTADDKGVVALTNVIREEVLADALKEGALLLLVKVHKSGGAYYTKKSMWTFFGGMPFFNMGGVVGSFVLIDGTDGKVLASGVVPIHGGFVKANDLEEEVN